MFRVFVACYGSMIIGTGGIVAGMLFEMQRVVDCGAILLMLGFMFLSTIGR